MSFVSNDDYIDGVEDKHLIWQHVFPDCCFCGWIAIGEACFDNVGAEIFEGEIDGENGLNEMNIEKYFLDFSRFICYFVAANIVLLGCIQDFFPNIFQLGLNSGHVLQLAYPLFVHLCSLKKEHFLDLVQILQFDLHSQLVLF